MKKFYLTTPIYYVNDKPHIGSFYTTMVADVVARYRRLRGDDVLFLAGTDENSQKNEEAAKKAGETDIQAYVDRMSANWRATWTELDITFDGFIRTTEERHKKGVEKFWKEVSAKDDIYQGEYEGLYCTGCEAFYKETDLILGNCPIHKKPVVALKEKNWFFRLTKYRQALLDHIDRHPEFVRPVSRRNEVRSYVERFMDDVSISRETIKWGIPVPGDPKSTVYVWFDALINYLTGVGYGTDDAAFSKWWPADLHLVGKDIIKFHCAMWPAMLLSAGLPLPKSVFAHGFLTINGEKMSKSLGNVIDPIATAKSFGIDALRFFLLREISFGEDGDFSLARLEQRYTGDLGNDYGNLLHRVLSMTEKYFGGRVPEATDGTLAPTFETYEKAMDALDFTDALDAVWNVLRQANKTIDDEKPWVLAKSDEKRLAEVIYRLLETLRLASRMLLPIMPGIAKKAFVQLGIPEEGKRDWDEAKVWGRLKEGDKIEKGEPLFPRIV